MSEERGSWNWLGKGDVSALFGKILELSSDIRQFSDRQAQAQAHNERQREELRLDLAAVKTDVAAVKQDTNLVKEYTHKNSHEIKNWQQVATGRFMKLEDAAKLNATKIDTLTTNVDQRLNNIEGPVQEIIGIRKKLVATISLIAAVAIPVSSFLSPVFSAIWKALLDRSISSR